MTTTDFTTTIVVDQTPEEVFNAVNNVRGWWSEEIDGSTDHLNAQFDYHYEDVHRSKMKIQIFFDKLLLLTILKKIYKHSSHRGHIAFNNFFSTFTH